MAHRGTRSDEATLRRIAKQVIYSSAYVDKQLGEVVSRTSQSDVVNAVTAQLATFTERNLPIPEVCAGLVMHNQQATGVFDDTWPTP